MDNHPLIDSLRSLPWNVIAVNTNKFAPKLVLVLLLVLLVKSFAELTWSFFEGQETEAVSSNNKRPLISANNTKVVSSSLEQVVQYHLFGNARKKVAVPQQKVINAPDTRLHLVLQGVFASSNKAKALAIIATKKGKGKAYRIGKKVNGGTVLHAVYADRVILKRGGKLETLRLLKASTKNLYNKNSEKVGRLNKPLQRPKRANNKLLEQRKALLSD